MLSVRFIANVVRARKQLDAVANSEALIASEMRAFMDQMLRLYKQATPKDTGQLAAGWRANVIVRGGVIRGEMSNAAPKGANIFEFLRRGTKAHVIRAKSGGVLAFEDSAGAAVFAKLVKHPGTNPAPSLGRPFQDSVAALTKRMVEDIQAKIAQRANSA